MYYFKNLAAYICGIFTTHQLRSADIKYIYTTLAFLPQNMIFIQHNSTCDMSSIHALPSFVPCNMILNCTLALCVAGIFVVYILLTFAINISTILLQFSIVQITPCCIRPKTKHSAEYQSFNCLFYRNNIEINKYSKLLKWIYVTNWNYKNQIIESRVDE